MGLHAVLVEGNRQLQLMVLWWWRVGLCGGAENHHLAQLYFYSVHVVNVSEEHFPYKTRSSDQHPSTI